MESLTWNTLGLLPSCLYSEHEQQQSLPNVSTTTTTSLRSNGQELHTQAARETNEGKVVQKMSAKAPPPPPPPPSTQLVATSQPPAPPYVHPTASYQPLYTTTTTTSPYGHIPGSMAQHTTTTMYVTTTHGPPQAHLPQISMPAEYTTTYAPQIYYHGAPIYCRTQHYEPTTQIVYSAPPPTVLYDRTMTTQTYTMESSGTHGPVWVVAPPTPQPHPHTTQIIMSSPTVTTQRQQESDIVRPSGVLSMSSSTSGESNAGPPSSTPEVTTTVKPPTPIAVPSTSTTTSHNASVTSVPERPRAPRGGSNVYVSGLPKWFRDRHLLALCEPFGTVVSVKAVSDPRVERGAEKICRGFGFVMYASEQLAMAAVSALHSKTAMSAQDNGEVVVIGPLQAKLAHVSAAPSKTDLRLPEAM